MSFSPQPHSSQRPTRSSMPSGSSHGVAAPVRTPKNTDVPATPVKEREMMRVRAQAFAVHLPDRPAPWDRCLGRVLYMAGPPDEISRDTGMLSPIEDHGRRPVVVLLGGMNLPCSSYGWLAQHLVESGFIAVCYDHVESPMPGFEGLGPGLDVEPLRPGGAPGPCATVLGPLLETLERLDAEVLPGCIDTDRVVLFGHSAGGTAALFSGGWFPAVRGVVTYGSHAGISTTLGYPPGTVLPIERPVPTLLIGGDADAVVAASGLRYGGITGPIGLLQRTFDEALSGPGHGLVVLSRGQHLDLCHPHNTTLGRGFLEPPTDHAEETRAVFAELLVAFAQRCTGGPDAFEQVLTDHATTITHVELR